MTFEIDPQVGAALAAMSNGGSSLKCFQARNPQGDPSPNFVAGAGFEPATSGRHQGHRDDYGLWPEATDSLGVVRDSPSLPVSEYPAGTGWD
jgi:hypothetical protein